MFIKRNNRRKKSITQHTITILKTLLLASILAFAIWSAQNTNPTEFLEVDISWNIDKNEIVGKDELEGKISALINSKIQLDLHQIKLAIESHPWVAQAHVKRLFWNSISIDITTQTVAMKWRNKDCKKDDDSHKCIGYISTYGDLFIPDKMIKSDAVLATSSNDQDVAKKLYQNYQSYKKIIEPMIINSYSKTNIDKLDVEPNVKVILGYQQQQQRLERFKKVYNKLIKENSRIKNATFDMRYNKGFSISY